MQEVGVDDALHQHTAEDAAQHRGGTHQRTAPAAEQGADGVKPAQAFRMEPPGRFNAQHGGKPAQQHRHEQQSCGPALLHEPLLNEHLGQVAGDAEDSGGDDELRRQRGGAKSGDAVPHQPRELVGQVAEGLLLPAGLRLGDDGLGHQGGGGSGSAFKGGAQQVETGKAEKPFQRAGEGPHSRGQHGELGAVGGDPEVVVCPSALLEAVVSQGRGGAGEHGVGQCAQRHRQADEKEVRRKGHQEVGEHHADPAGHECLPAAQQVRRHAARHLEGEADHVEHALGNADLPQREAPRSQQRHPHRVGDAQAGEEVVGIDAGKLLFQVEFMVHGGTPFLLLWIEMCTLFIYFCAKQKRPIAKLRGA